MCVSVGDAGVEADETSTEAVDVAAVAGAVEAVGGGTGVVVVAAADGGAAAGTLGKSIVDGERLTEFADV